METLDREFIELCKQDKIEKRIALSIEMKKYSDILVDYLTIFQAYENKDREAAIIWGGREWYRKLYENEVSKNNVYFCEDSNPVNSESAKTEAEIRLQEIQNMRTWKMIEKYRNFMDNTVVGRILSKLRDICRQVFFK